MLGLSMRVGEEDESEMALGGNRGSGGKGRVGVEIT